jgi:ParB family chromosome partitioning protein
LAVPIEQLRPMPGNPHHGDVEALMRSRDRFGQRRPLIARRDGDADAGEVIAGNHGLEAARRLGWSHIAVAWVDDDRATALAFAAADNRTAQLGHDDPEAMAALLMTVRASDADLFAATAWTDKDLAKLLDGGPSSVDRRKRDGGGTLSDQALESSWAVMVSCADEAGQLDLLERLGAEGYQCRALIS